MTQAEPPPSSPQPKQRTGALLHAVADILDFVTIFFVGGLVVGGLTGSLTWTG